MWSRGGGGAAAAEGVDEEEKWITPMVKGEQICDESTGSSLITWTASHASLEITLLSFYFFFSASNWVMDSF